MQSELVILIVEPHEADMIALFVRNWLRKTHFLFKYEIFRECAKAKFAIENGIQPFLAFIDYSAVYTGSRKGCMDLVQSLRQKYPNTFIVIMQEGGILDSVLLEAKNTGLANMVAKKPLLRQAINDILKQVSFPSD